MHIHTHVHRHTCTQTHIHAYHTTGQSDDEDDEGSPRSMERMDSDDVLACLTGSGGETLVDIPSLRHSIEPPDVEDEQVRAVGMGGREGLGK